MPDLTSVKAPGPPFCNTPSNELLPVLPMVSVARERHRRRVLHYRRAAIAVETADRDAIGIEGQGPGASWPERDGIGCCGVEDPVAPNASCTSPELIVKPPVKELLIGEVKRAAPLT